MTVYLPAGPEWTRNVRIREKAKRSHRCKPWSLGSSENVAPTVYSPLPYFTCGCGFTWHAGDPIPGRVKAPPRKSRKRS